MSCNSFLLTTVQLKNKHNTDLIKLDPTLDIKLQCKFTLRLNFVTLFLLLVLRRLTKQTVFSFAEIFLLDGVLVKAARKLVVCNLAADAFTS